MVAWDFASSIGWEASPIYPRPGKSRIIIDNHFAMPVGSRPAFGFSRVPPATDGRSAMPLFLIERNFAEEVALTDDDAAQIKQVNDEIGVQWLYSFLSVDRRKSYCLYEAPNAEAILASAKRLNVPADVIIPVGELRPEQFATAMTPPGAAAARRAEPRARQDPPRRC